MTEIKESMLKGMKMKKLILIANAMGIHVPKVMAQGDLIRLILFGNPGNVIFNS